VVDEPLAVAFASRLPAEQRACGGVNLEDELVALVARARTEAEGVELDPKEFVGYVAERVAFDKLGGPVLRSLRAGDLWIAFGCVTGVASAIDAFEARYAPEITGALRRSFELGLAQDAELRVRERLFLVGENEAQRLASYSGRGDLRTWLRAAAVRMAIDVMRARREVPVSPGSLAEIGDLADPMLASLKERYRDEFRVAFGEAASALTDRERTLLRYRFLDGLSIDEIGALYRVHRATVARWISAIREGLFEATRAGLMSQLRISDTEADSVLRLIDSHLDVSIETVMRQGDPAS
jgi:RNA polymerase sigma-70 factor (ECF subfamily)